MKFIPLSQGLQALVDDEDFAKVSGFNWYAYRHGNTYYAQRKLPWDGADKPRRSILLHRELVSALPGELVDHKDGNGLDNRRENLRKASYTENSRNRRKPNGGVSRLKGVRWFQKEKCWGAQITVKYRQTHLGCFTSETEAALAYDAAARQLFGKYARTNFSN